MGARVRPPGVGPPRVGGPKFRAFFPAPATIFILSSLLGCSRGILLVFLKRGDPHMCTFGVLGPKRAHLSEILGRGAVLGRVVLGEGRRKKKTMKRKKKRSKTKKEKEKKNRRIAEKEQKEKKRWKNNGKQGKPKEKQRQTRKNRKRCRRGLEGVLPSRAEKLIFLKEMVRKIVTKLSNKNNYNYDDNNSKLAWPE